MNIFLDNFDNQFSLDTVTCPTLADMFTKGPEVNKVYDNFITTFKIHSQLPLPCKHRKSVHNSVMDIVLAHSKSSALLKPFYLVK